MDYNKLKTFVTVAELGSITGAAHAMRRSQPAITQQIQLLEEELELKLLERKSGRIYLSPDGQEIFDIAKRQLGELDDEILRLKKSAAAVEGHIRVGALQDFGTEFAIGAAIAKFAKKQPNISFEISHGTSASLEQDLINKKIDLGFSIVFTQPELFIRQSILSSQHSLYTSKAYLTQTGPIRSFKDLLDRDLIDLTEDFLALGTFFRKNAKTLVGSLNHRRPKVVAPNLAVAKQIVSEGFGIAMLPDYLVAKEVKKGSIVQLLKSAKSLTGELDAAYRTNRNLRACEDLFLKSL